MATGLPIVATAADGTAEAVQQGVNGILTPPGGADGAGRDAAAALAESHAGQTNGRGGPRRVDEFSDKRMVAQIDALYRGLLAAKGIKVENKE